MTTLWRAADEPGYTAQWSCWSTSRMNAVAYMDNPGFGGNALYRASVGHARVLDLTGERDEFAALHDAICSAATADERYDRLTDWRSRGYSYVWDMWENDPEVANLLATRFSWVVYLDNYPDSAETWCYLGTETLPATLTARRLTGEDAIEYAAAHGLALRLEGDPEARLSTEGATDEDPNSLWILAPVR